MCTSLSSVQFQLFAQSMTTQQRKVTVLTLGLIQQTICARFQAWLLHSSRNALKSAPLFAEFGFVCFFSSETKFNSDVLYAKRPKHERLKRTPLVVSNGTGQNNVQIFEADHFLLPATERQLF